MQDSGCDVSNDKLAMQRLREAAEKAKRELDGLAQTEVSLPFITADASGPKHMSIKVTKAQFEKLAEKLVERTMGPMEKCLKDAGVKTKDVDEILLVGGMTRMPRVQEKVKAFFGKEPSKGVNPDEVVAMGAAIQVRTLQERRMLGNRVEDVLWPLACDLSIPIVALLPSFQMYCWRCSCQNSSLFSHLTCSRLLFPFLSLSLPLVLFL